MVEAVKEIEEIQSYKTQSEAIEAAKKSAPLAKRIAGKILSWYLVFISFYILILLSFTKLNFDLGVTWLTTGFISNFVTYVSLISFISIIIKRNKSSSDFDDEDDDLRKDDSRSSDWQSDPGYSSTPGNYYHRY